MLQNLSVRRGVMSDHVLFCTHSELSCKSLEGQEGLRQLIFHVTCNMKDVGSTIGCQRLAGRLVGTVGRIPLKPEGLFPIRQESKLPSPPIVKHVCCGLRLNSPPCEQFSGAGVGKAGDGAARREVHTLKPPRAASRVGWAGHTSGPEGPSLPPLHPRSPGAT